MEESKELPSDPLQVVADSIKQAINIQCEKIVLPENVNKHFVRVNRKFNCFSSNIIFISDKD
jgi:hypothetical protein